MPLKDAAIAVRENAYAPYSHFKVGAAIRGGLPARHLRRSRSHRGDGRGG
jgi:hypothetical protein